jgi:hypothetical protein
VREFGCEYDFADSWHHDIVIEQTMPSVGAGTPHLIDGAGACPPEDCGGSGGSEHLVEVLANASHEEHDETLEWVGGAPTTLACSTSTHSTLRWSFTTGAAPHSRRISSAPTRSGRR